MRSQFAAAFFVLGLAWPAQATTSIDLFNSPQLNGPYQLLGPCYCQDAYATGFFAVTPGSTVDFGVLTIEPAWLYDHYYPYTPIQMTFSLITNTDINNPIDWAYPPGGNTPVTYDLTSFIIPNDANYIQFSWLGPTEYTPPAVVAAVPETSTWVMLLIGFAGLGALAHRRKRLALQDGYR